MKKLLIIFGTVFVVSALTGWVASYDVDDVYYWPDNTPAPTTQVTSAEQTTQSIPTTPTTSQNITYIEDSVTLHSDTIVKAVIHR